MFLRSGSGPAAARAPGCRCRRSWPCAPAACLRRTAKPRSCCCLRVLSDLIAFSQRDEVLRRNARRLPCDARCSIRDAVDLLWAPWAKPGFAAKCTQTFLPVILSSSFHGHGSSRASIFEEIQDLRRWRHLQVRGPFNPLTAHPWMEFALKCSPGHSRSAKMAICLSFD